MASHGSSDTPGLSRRTTSELPRRHAQRLLLWALWIVLLGYSTTVTAKPRDIDPSLLDALVERMAQPYEDTDRFDAEVWLLVSEQRLKRWVKTENERLQLLQLVYLEANHHGLDPDLVLAVMHIESHFNRFAISRVGAQGLMQVMPFWRVEIGRPQDNLTDTATNIRYGTAILAHYMEVAKNDLVDALGRYNGSRGRLKYPEKVVGAWRRYWRNNTLEDSPELSESCSNYQLKACRYR
ncbi:MAG: lytic transglycosylase domain-containing protein [Pseudomonadales bacterium]